MEKFKPVLKFCGIYIVTVIELVVMDMFYRAMIDVFDITVPKSAFDTVIAESFILVSVIVTWKYGLIDLPLEFKNGRDTLSKNALSLFAGVLWVVVIMFLQYIHISDNVDFNVDGPKDVLLIYSHLSETWFGLFMVGIGGPLTEELFFRTAVLGLMLRSGVKPWVAIVLSAFLFGIFHLNVWQFVGSGLFGLMIGYIYYKTNNILVVMIIHVFNNTLGAVLLGMFFLKFNAPNAVGISVSVVFMIFFAIAGVFVMKRFISRYPQPQFVENEELDELVMEEC
jgi:membrane protease YdiL (CAAX protease family)